MARKNISNHSKPYKKAGQPGRRPNAEKVGPTVETLAKQDSQYFKEEADIIGMYANQRSKKKSKATHKHDLQVDKERYKREQELLGKRTQ